MDRAGCYFYIELSEKTSHISWYLRRDLEKSEGISPEYTWQESISGRGNSMYKGPEVGACLRNSKEDGVTRKKRGVMGMENCGVLVCRWLEASRITGTSNVSTMIREASSHRRIWVETSGDWMIYTLQGLLWYRLENIWNQLKSNNSVYREWRLDSSW